MTFKEWLQGQGISQPGKPWKASKDEIISHWQQLAPSMPLTPLRVIPQGHRGPTYSYDGIRITGSTQFIDYVLSRLRELLGYDSGQTTRLNVIYKQQVDNKTEQPVPDAYTFYVQVKQRGKNL